LKQKEGNRSDGGRGKGSESERERVWGD